MAQRFKAKTLISNSGVFNNEVIAPNLVYNTGDQTISGVKTFATGIVVSGNLQVSGTGIFNAIDLNSIDILSLSGVDVAITSGNVILTNPLSAPNLIYNTGNQTISGFKTFADDLSIKNNVFFISQASGFLSGSNYYGNYNGGVFAGGIRLSQSSLSLVENSFSTKWNPSEGNAGSTSRNWKRIVINGLGKYQIGIVYGGTVYVSDNYGENFSPKTSIVGASNNWSDVAISTDGKYSIASVDQGYVWLSDNYGTNWTQSNILGIRNWKCVALSSTAQYQIAISQDSETIASLWISKNYGKNWSSSAITAKNASSATISSDGKYQRIALYSDQNSLYSNNYGNTWTSTTQQTTGCSHTRISSDGAYQLLSTDEYVKISKDYGITWVDEFRTPNNKIKDLTISANAHFQAIAVENNYIYASYNYGKSGTWEQVGLSGNWSTIDINSNGKNLTAARSGITSGFVFVSNTDEKVRGDLYADHMEALNLVYNTGDQIISGQKTFAKGTSLSSGSLSISGDSIENYNLIFSKFSRETATFSIIGFQKTAGSVNPASVTTSQPHNFKIGDSVAISDIRTPSCASSALNGGYIISNITSPTIFQYLTPGNESSALSNASFVSLLTTCSNAPTATAFSYFSKSSSLRSDINLNSNNIISNSPFIAPNLVYNTGNQTISGVKTFIGNHIISGNLTVSGNIINSGVADIYPPSTGIRRYYPEGFQSMATVSPFSGNISYHPFLIKKDITNLQLCVELTTTNITNTPIRVGIYSGAGFEGARLFWSGSIPTTNATPAIYKTTANINLPKGPYVIASCNTGVAQAEASQFRTIGNNLYRSIFGEAVGTTVFSASSTLSAIAPYETGNDLKQTIGSGVWASAAVGLFGPIICLEY